MYDSVASSLKECDNIVAKCNKGYTIVYASDGRFNSRQDLQQEPPEYLGRVVQQHVYWGILFVQI